MVFPLFARVSLPCGNQAYQSPAHGIGDRIKPPFHHAERKAPLFAVISAPVLAVQPVRVEKDAGGIFERYAMLGDVLRGFPFVPFV